MGVFRVQPLRLTDYEPLYAPPCVLLDIAANAEPLMNHILGLQNGGHAAVISNLRQVIAT